MKTVLLMCNLIWLQSAAAVELHPGLNGPWHQAENPGQGLVLHLIPENNQIFIAWFTYSANGGEQMWLTAHGSLDNNPIQLTIYQSINGRLNSNQQLPEQILWGTGSIDFSSCSAAEFNYQGEVQGSMALSRITAPISCSEASP
ncbi:hypothetical protein [Marinicella litoralis]|uniref:Uncharacterized protein n=1 Tax=Marinicella litoralis TaxID=644220 RepID=A0A4R6XR06_9GAMM|nr:hypothetical protein [Marinicella litoralis]TDR20670.1 hypothetical protein C8D91_1646 [Marinicella litoralis]